MPVKTRQEQSLATRGRLLRAARELFTSRGYAATSTEDIVRHAGLTRGALYHQFRDKEDLFRAAYEEIEHEFEEKIRLRVTSETRAGANAWQGVRRGAQAFLDLSQDPEIQRIALRDAPAVLGPGSGRDVARLGLELIRLGLLRSMERGLIPPQPIEPLAHLLRAAITDAAMLIARSDDQATARQEVGAALDRLINGLAATR